MTGPDTGPGNRRVYLDWNATAPLRPEARDAMLAAMDAVGNPSSVHAEGRAAKAIVETARGQVAALAQVDRDRVVFTSSATEAAAQALSGRGLRAGGIEHDCVSVWCASGVAVDADGLATVDGDPAGTALQAANSETGVVQALPPGLGFVDAVQAAGKIAFDAGSTGATMTALSAHKLGGPKGCGALALGPGVAPPVLIQGGGQEQNRRAGTENVIGIAGFGAAAMAAMRDLDAGVWERVAKLRNILEERLESVASDLIIFGREAPRLPNTSCFAVPGWAGETQVMQMDLAGFAVSAGSACSSGKVRKASRALTAMGFDEITASSAIRVSMGPTTTEAEVMAFADAWTAAWQRRRARVA